LISSTDKARLTSENTKQGADVATKAKKSKEQTYQHKQNAVNITLYDLHGEALSESAKHEMENAALEVAMNHNLLLSIATT
jgi:hypothetical protein